MQSHQLLFLTASRWASPLLGDWVSKTIISETGRTKNQYVTGSVHNHCWDWCTIICESSCHLYNHCWDWFALSL